jgi:hypothetical protein
MPTDSANLYWKNADDCRERSLMGTIAQVPLRRWARSVASLRTDFIIVIIVRGVR